MTDDDIGSTAYVTEYSCRINRAVTPMTVEMTACAVSRSVTEIAYAAWDDGSDWDDGAVGWDDFPPADL